MQANQRNERQEEIKAQEAANQAAANAVADEERNRPERQEKRLQFLAIKKKIEEQKGAGQAALNQKLIKHAQRDKFVEQHKKWLLKKLFSQRDKSGDVVFKFRRNGGAPGDDI